MQSRELVKLYYRIGEVSEIVGVQPHVLRYWESEFRSIRPQKSSKGQRVYSRRDVEKLLRVKDLLRNQGFTIAGARKRLSDPTDAAAAPATPAAGSAGTPTAAPPMAAVPNVTAANVTAANVAPPAAVSAPAVMSLVESVVPVVVPRVAAVASAEQASAERAILAGAAERSAKDMRKALLGLRQDLMRMLAELNATRTQERRGH